jgi:hypothetical protein
VIGESRKDIRRVVVSAAGSGLTLRRFLRV